MDDVELRQSEARARLTVLVHALEVADQRGDLIPHERRRQATLDAKPGKGDWLGRRSEKLGQAATEALGIWPLLRRLSAPVHPLFLPVALIALLLGLATNGLGSDQRIHVLAVPLLALLAWNVLSLLLLLARNALPIQGTGTHPILNSLRRLARRTLLRNVPQDDTNAALRAQVATTFLDDWVAIAAPLEAARLRRLLHVSALLMVGGAVAGMYARGLLFAYEATWESTFLNGENVDLLLRTILGPAAWLLGMEVPAAAPIQAPEAGPAAPWIYLWSVTAALWVGLPRLLLALVETLRIARLRRRLRLRLPGLYLRRLQAAASATTERVDVVPYSYSVPASASDRLRGHLQDVFGARADIRLCATIEYGQEAKEVDFTGGRACVLLFNLAQTPELEVHGELIRELRAELPDGKAFIVLVDSSVLRERNQDPRRIAERRRAWDRIAHDADAMAVHLDLKTENDDAVAALVAGAWPPGALENAL